MSEFAGTGVSDYPRADGLVYDNELDELYRPHLIPSKTHMILLEQILTLMPPQRNVILSMNEYPMNEINPVHPNTPESPTHVIIFCIRFIADDIFQPIGGLLVYKHLDQSAILANCVKAYISDLWKLGLFVVATVSPAFKIFKAIMSYVADIKDLDSHSDVISYSVQPLKEIIHIYDIQFLLIKLQTLIKDGDVKYEEDNIFEKKVMEASWRDLSTVFSLNSEFKVLADFLTTDEQISRRVHIFTEQIYQYFLQSMDQGVLSSKAEGCAILLNGVRTFLRFTEEDRVHLDEVKSAEDWSRLTNILRTMTFQKTRFRTCTKDKSSVVAHPLTNPSIRKKIDFTSDEHRNAATKNNGSKDETTNENLAKSKSKKHKKKKKGKKAETKNSSPVETLEKMQSLAKIEELCEMLKSTGSLQSVDSSEQNEPYDGISEEQEAKLKKNSDKIEIIEDIVEPMIEKNCDTDRNNNSDESMQENHDPTNSSACHRQIRVRNDMTDENVINGKGFNGNNHHDEKSVELNNGELLSEIDVASKFVDSKDLSCDNNFYSKSDEETEMSINKSCDKIPNIIDLLNNVENNEIPPDSPDVPDVEFESNPVTNEMLTTIYGIRKLLRLLEAKRLKVAKPDAFIVEHIDYLVTMIQEKNMINPVHYYGHNYGFMNSVLAFSTLSNENGLYLISKD